MAAIIERDPYARATLYRERVYPAETQTHQGCAWCGSVKQTRDARRSYLFHYWWEGDDKGRVPRTPATRLFCSVGCFRTYHAP